jgi:hypothetical protein
MSSVTRTAERILPSLWAATDHICVTSSLREMLHAVVHEARTQLRGAATVLYLRRGERLQPSACSAPAYLPGGADWPCRQSLTVELDTPPGYVAATQRPLHIDARTQPPANARFDSPIGPSPHLPRLTVDALVALPLREDDQSVLGVLVGYNPRPLVEPADAPGEMTMLARMISLDVRNAILRSRLREMQLDTVYRMTHAAEMCDEGMHDHVRRMSRTAGILARRLGLHAGQAELIEHASPMHDIGKLGIPEAILRKPQRLGRQEREVIETHARIGADILRGSSNEILHAARSLALTHHERWDGRGYPQRLRAEQIPIGGRIVTLADVFDALVSPRCYKPAYSLPVAVGLIQQERGRHFDPDVVEAFGLSLREILGVYGMGSGQAPACEVA